MSGPSRLASVAVVAREYLARAAASARRLSVPADVVRLVPQDWVSADDVRILWFIQTYQDLSRLRVALAKLRTLYPESQVLVVSDGDPDPRVEQACRQHSAEFTLRPRLFAVEHGGEPAQRMLEAFLRTDADLLIKIDPDTDVRRRFSRMPPRTDTSLYGTVQVVGAKSNNLTSIQGGCIILPRHAAMLLANSALLESERLKPPALEWAVNAMSVARAASGLTSYDWTLGWACRELGIPSRDHPEVFSRYRPGLIDTLTDRWVAVSHPRFDIRQVTKATFYFGGLQAAIRDAMSREGRK